MEKAKEIFKKIIALKLKWLAQLTLWRYQPKIIGVTGSVGKSSAKEAIFAVLKSRYRVRRNIKNYNNELGVPLTILGQESGGGSLFHWVKVLLVGFFQAIYTKGYPEILVLEMGADRIGDIGYLTSFVPCQVGVVTAIGEIPVHVEFFQSPSQVVKEKAKLVNCLGRDGWAVLNYDDERVRGMATKTGAQIFFYGFGEGADLRASQMEEHYSDFNEAGLSFKVDYQGSNVPIRLSHVLATHQISDALAGVAVGLIFKMNLVDIARALRDYRPPAGRLNLLRGIKKSWVIDDTYNSSPSSSLAALDVLEKIPGSRPGEVGRKIAALGDMLELGAYTEEAHRQVGARAAKVVNYLFAIGERSIFMAEEAKKKGLAEEKIFYFASSEEATRALRELIREGDVILVKGSQGIRMEKLTKEIMAEQDRAKELLVRQEEAWKKR